MKDRNREALLNIHAHDGMDKDTARRISEYCCLFYHPDSPLMKMKDRKQRMLKALEESGVPEEVAKSIARNGKDFQRVLGLWFREYGNDKVEYYISLCVKIDQLNEVLREPMDLSEISADDKAKTIKFNCDAAKELGELIKIKDAVEKQVFSEDRSTRDEVRKALADSLSPESMAGFNRNE